MSPCGPGPAVKMQRCVLLVVAGIVTLSPGSVLGLPPLLRTEVDSGPGPGPGPGLDLDPPPQVDSGPGPGPGPGPGLDLDPPPQVDSGPGPGPGPGPGLDLDPPRTLQDLEQENLLPPSRSRPGWSPVDRVQVQDRVQDRVQVLDPQENPDRFTLDLRNVPELANADLESENPNIQVSIEVLEGFHSETELDMDLGTDSERSDWTQNNRKNLFWPLFWDQLENSVDQDQDQDQDQDRDRDRDQDRDQDREQDQDQDRDQNQDQDRDRDQDPGDWDGHWNNDWDAKDNYEYEEDWSSWVPCSVSCGPGTQRRTRSCGYSCTATESRTCQITPCADSSTSRPEVTSITPDALDTNVDSCEKWLSCRTDFLQSYLHQVTTELPSCPCSYPSEAVYGAVHMVDPALRKSYRWRDASGPKERLDIYKPSARFCIRSMLSYHSTTLAAQHCCYDRRMRLITRGNGAGSPDLISTEFSPELHYKVDVLPWILCKGDWSRVHSVRPPNNGMECPENPQEEEFREELKEAREY